MKIVILDGYTLNPGDLDWGPLHDLGDVTIFDRTPNDLILERAKDADIVLTNKTPLSKAVIAQLPKLKCIVVLATGYDIIDIGEAKKCNIPVCNASGYATDSVAQHTIGFMLELMNRIALHDQKVKDGFWNVDFSFFAKPIRELKGKTLGLIGYGRIGQRVAELARSFEMNLLIKRKHPEENDDGCKATTEEIAKHSDVVSLHCPLTEETREIINEGFLQQMKNQAILINTSRGPLVNELALTKALREGWIAAAGLDVLANEPPKEETPLLKAPNCMITPHNAWATVESRQRLMDIIVDNVKAFLDGRPQNVVNP